MGSAIAWWLTSLLALGNARPLHSQIGCLAAPATVTDPAGDAVAAVTRKHAANAYRPLLCVLLLELLPHHASSCSPDVCALVLLLLAYLRLDICVALGKERKAVRDKHHVVLDAFMLQALLPQCMKVLQQLVWPQRLLGDRCNACS